MVGNSTVSTTTLRPVQARVVKALAEGSTIRAAALDNGIHRWTIHNWFRNDPRFAKAVEQWEARYISSLVGPGVEMEELAISTLRDLITNPSTPLDVRTEACLAVLKFSPVLNHKP